MSSHRPLLLAAALLVGFMLLAVALDGFELRRGLRLETDVADTVERVLELRERESRNYYDGRVIGWVVSVVAGVSIVLFFVGLARRENRLSTLMLVVIGMGAALVITRMPPPQEELETRLEEGETDGAGGDGAIPLIDEMDEEDAADVEPEAPTGSGVVSWIIAGVAAVAVVLVVRPRIRWPVRRRTPDEDSVEQSARAAVVRAESGEDVLATVIRCYRDMLEVYRRTRHAGRAHTLTPRELSGRLVDAGVPRDHADGLTRLFEEARYGDVKLTPDEERQAVEHLRVIAGSLERGRD